MLGKLPLVSTSFANLTTDESLEPVSMATDYEKLIPIHYFLLPDDSTSTTDSGLESSVQRSGKGTHIALECVLASAVQLFSKLCSVISVERAWKGFSRAVGAWPRVRSHESQISWP
jgi:hypothetical protein